LCVTHDHASNRKNMLTEVYFATGVPATTAPSAMCPWKSGIGWLS
jgi:hypothetical protein